MPADTLSLFQDDESGHPLGFAGLMIQLKGNLH